MRIYAVLDTNVLVSAMLTRHKNSATKRIIDAASDLSLTPLYHEDIIKEYKNVLRRDKFGFDSTDVENMLDVISWCAHKPSAQSLQDFLRERLGG